MIRLTYSLLFLNLDFLCDLSESSGLDASILLNVSSKVFIFFVKDVFPYSFSLSQQLYCLYKVLVLRGERLELLGNVSRAKLLILSNQCFYLCA